MFKINGMECSKSMAWYVQNQWHGMFKSYGMVCSKSMAWLVQNLWHGMFQINGMVCNDHQDGIPEEISMPRPWIIERPQFMSILIYMHKPRIIIIDMP